MSCVTMVPLHAGTDRPARRPFASRVKQRAAPDEVARQARFTLLAFQAFDDRADALAFLNGHCEALGGRPIDAAGRDEAGLVAASELLADVRA